MKLRLTTCMAANTHEPGRVIATYLGKRLGIGTEFILDLPWSERKAALLNGEIEVGWICGLWYAQQARPPHPPLELLATPVYLGMRYANRPVYFSDIVVREDSPVTCFTDLHDATWVYNEPCSLSGYEIMRQALAERGRELTFFGRVVESGGHLLSLAMVADGRADVAAIDSTVWDYAEKTRPGLCAGLRVIDVLGPNPAPPWVISRQVPAGLRAEIREVLLGMHTRPEGHKLLDEGGLFRFAAVEHKDYEAIAIPAGAP